MMKTNSCEVHRIDVHSTVVSLRSVKNSPGDDRPRNVGLGIFSSPTLTTGKKTAQSNAKPGGSSAIKSVKKICEILLARDHDEQHYAETHDIPDESMTNHCVLERFICRRRRDRSLCVVRRHSNDHSCRAAGLLPKPLCCALLFFSFFL